MILVENKFNIGDECYTGYRQPVKYKCPICEGNGVFTHNGYLLWLFAFTALMDNKTNDYTREVKCENQG